MRVTACNGFVLLLLGTLPSLAQSAFVNLDAPGQYTANFSQWNDNGGGGDGGNYAFAQSAMGGVENSGCASVFQSTDTTATYKNGSWNFSTNGAVVVVSAMVHADGQSSGDKLQLGVLNCHTNGFNGNGGVSFESFRFVPNSATSWSLREQFRSGNSNTETTLGNLNITIGHWYKLVVSLTNTSGSTGNYNAGCALIDYDVDGLSPGANVIGFPTVQVHSTGQDIARQAAVWPGLRAFQDAGIDAWDNFLVYTPASKPLLTHPLTDGSAFIGSPATFKALADGPGPLAFAWFTNGVLVAGETNYFYTIPTVSSNPTNVMVVVSNVNGTVTNSAALTLLPATAAVLANAPATDLLPGAATLNGQVLSTGGNVPNVTLYYGTTDGGTNATAWANHVALGPQSGPFSAEIIGLTSGVTCYFTAQAANNAGISWASPSLSFLPSAASPLTSYVNPFIGTAPSPLSHYGFSFDTGDVFPGAAYPLGMFQFSPDTPSGQAGGYWYPDTSIIGFSTRHFSGRGIHCYQDFSFKPLMGQVTVSPAATNGTYSVAFSHTNESASPGYYSVRLNNGVQVELTATPHTGMARFTFPSTNAATVAIDAGSTVGGNTANTSVTVVGTNQIQGYATGHIGGGSQGYTIYFVAQFDRGFSNPGTWNGTNVNPGTLSSTGSQVGAFLSFDATANPVVQAKMGLSFVSINNALANLNAENTNWNFAAVQNAADAAWNNTLGKIVVSGGTFAQQQTFYTALYHCFFHPNVVNDVNGQYMGMDGQVHTVKSGHFQYENISSWDNYRSAMPLRAFLSPSVASDIVQSLVNYAQQGGGGLPAWEQTYRNSENMGGDDPAISVAGAYALGATNFDTAGALAAMKLGAGTAGTKSDGCSVRSALGQYVSFGYVTNQAATTLTYCGDDFALYQFSQMIGDADPSDVIYLNRSGNWRNLFNSTNNLIQPRNSDGTWVSVSPGTQNGYQEGSAMQYTWLVPFNLKGLFTAMGGNSNVVSMLNNFFQQLNAGPNNPCEWAGNEPCECVPWEYDYAGAPWGTQSAVHRILTQCFTNTPNGFPGNDDAGSISSWYIFAALGFYPETPSAGGFVIGSPLFPLATINLENGRQITIQGNNASLQNFYIQGMTINGAECTSLWLPFSTLKDGAALTFNLTNALCGWGTNLADAPPSFDDNLNLWISAIPSGLSAAADIGQVGLNWNASAGATSYNVKRSTISGAEVTIANVTGTSYTDTGLANGITYYYVVSALNTNGESADSSEVSAAPVSQPILQLRMPFTNSAAGDANAFTTASDTSGGGLNITMNMFTNGTVAGDLHGAPGTGVTVRNPNARALDMTTNTSVVWTTASYASGNSTREPIVSLVNSTMLTNLGVNGTITGFTVTFWLKGNMAFPATFGSGSAPRLWNLNTGATAGNPGSTANAMGMILNAATNLELYFGPNATVNGFSAPLVANQWYFVAVTYDGQTFNLYLGTDAGSVTLIGSAILAGQSVNLAALGAASLCIGNMGGLTRGLNGWMEDFRIYKHAGDFNFVENVRQSVTQSGASIPVLLHAEPNATQQHFTLGFAATSGIDYIIESSTNLANWTPLFTNLCSSNQTFLFIDTNATTPARFYRVRQQ